jgi:predicted RecB family nuclease
LAEALVAGAGDEGPVFVYNAGFEGRVLRELGQRFPDLAGPLQSIADRLVDLLPIAKAHFYAPSQHGSWSLKAVLPAACPDLSYEALDGVADGNMAVEAYQEAIHAETTPERRAELELQLLAYCHLDTLAMVRLWNVFAMIPTQHKD